METLVVVPQHRNQYYDRNSYHLHHTFGSPHRGFRDISCRFQATSDGILSTPSKPRRTSAAVTKKTPPSKTPSPTGSRGHGEKTMKNNGRSSPIPISFKSGTLEKSFSDDLSYSELWAGPTYSNSPPPSSLPIPKFSLRQKRSVSLELPARELGLRIHPIAKSAPSSPRGGECPSPNSFLHSTATNDLRRILNLDIADE